MSADPYVRIKFPRYVNADQRDMVKDIVHAKLGLDVNSVSEQWRQVGPYTTVTYTAIARPPARVSLEDIRATVDKCAEWEFCLGLGPRGKPVIVSLADDSPHIACSAGSGAGKSVLAMIVAIQVLRRGGRVIIIDRKGSHRWARDLPGVTYCVRVPDMHSALVGAADLAEARNLQAMAEPENWDPGQRILVIFEEMNATVAQLKAWWREQPESRSKPTPPGVQAFRNIMYMGRSAKVNLFGVAQMLTAQTTGGPEARENFGIRCLARYTANNWKMLVPQCPMPPRSRHRGRWQVVIGDDVYETQVAFPATPQGHLDVAAVREFAGAGVLAQTEPPTVGVTVSQCHSHAPDQGCHNCDRGFTLAEASRQPWCSLSYEALRQKRCRAKNWPTPTLRDGRPTWTKDQLLQAINQEVRNDA